MTILKSFPDNFGFEDSFIIWLLIYLFTYTVARYLEPVKFAHFYMH